MKKIFLIISFIIGALSADAQTSDAVVREYVRLLNDWLANPYDTQKKEQIKNILKPLDKKCTMKDEIVEMYNSDAGTMETDVNGYLTIFSEKTKWQKVQIEIQSLKNSSNSGINIITAILKYSGGFELVTATDFWIFNGKIGYIVTNDIEKYKMTSTILQTPRRAHEDNSFFTKEESMSSEIGQDFVQVLRKAQHAIKFKIGSSTILPSSYPILDEIVEMMMKYSNYILFIEGHTDNIGNSTDNLVLSRERAISIHNYLVNHGIYALRLHTTGYGASRPLVPNNSPLNRAKNRRVEFYIKTNIVEK